MSPTPRSRRAILALLLTALCGLAACSSASAAKVPHSFFGISPWDPATNADWNLVGRGKIGVLRTNLHWNQVETSPGARNWGADDDIVAHAAKAHTTLLPIVYGSPHFYEPVGSYGPRTKKGVAAYAKFMGDLVRRYGRKGTFWKQNKNLPYVPVTNWQVWNEPNFPPYWSYHVNAKEYFTLLKASYKAIKKADKHATVVLAGMPESKTGQFIEPYLTKLYKLGARRYFDIAAPHAYASTVARTLATVKSVRKVMAAHGDAKKPMWVTEVGWGTAGPHKAMYTPPKVQASRLKTLLTTLVKDRNKLHLRGVIVFSLRDRTLEPGEEDWWAPHSGLFTLGGKAKPAWKAFMKFTGGR